MTITVTTPAKLNLFLDVRARRPDGYHDIVSVMTPLAAPADILRITTTERPGIVIRCSHEAVPTDERNLCWQAAAALARCLGIAPHWHIEIEKAIPVAAGLGGGSSDAAAVLLALNRAQASGLTPTELAKIAFQVGADVPFFLDPEPKLVSGAGEALRALHVESGIPLVLVNPGFPVAAAWAYSRHDSMPRLSAPAVESLLRGLEEGDLEAIAAHTFNALAPAVCDKFPLVAMVLETLRDAGCLAATVAGSGPTVFGICPEAHRDTVLAAVADRFGECLWTCCTRNAAAGAGSGA